MLGVAVQYDSVHAFSCPWENAAGKRPVLRRIFLRNSVVMPEIEVDVDTIVSEIPIVVVAMIQLL